MKKKDEPVPWEESEPQGARFTASQISPPLPSCVSAQLCYLESQKWTGELSAAAAAALKATVWSLGGEGHQWDDLESPCSESLLPWRGSLKDAV